MFCRLSEKDPLSSPNGCDGKYRRTTSPQPQTPSGANNGLNNDYGKSPAKTPKRKSPATIAAKGELMIEISLERNFSFVSLPERD